MNGPRSAARRRRPALAIAAGLALAACGRPAATPGGPAHLRVGAHPFLVYAPFYVARDRGYFAAEGLEVEFVRLPPGAAELTALADDEVDVVAERPSVALLSALAAGERMAAVADLNHVAPEGCVHGAILARPALAGDPAPAALLGRRIEMDRAGIENFLLDRVLAPIGKTSADLETVDLDDPAIGEALADGAIDFAFTSEPWSSALVRSGKAVVWRSFQTIAPDFQLAFVLYGPRLLDREPEVGERFLAAYLRAVAALAGGPSGEDSARLARELGLAPAQLEALCPTPVRRDGTMSVEGLDEFQRWAVARGFLDRPAPLARFVEPRFVRAIAARTAAGGGRR